MVRAWRLFLLLSLSLPFMGYAQEETTEDPLALFGFKATSGAAAGYLSDNVCGTCHAPMFISYQNVGMAQSFGPPEKMKHIEDFGKVFFHEPSQRYYRIDKDGEKLIFHRYQKDDQGEAINAYQDEIAWVMGSGNRARSYLFQSEWGELYMAPLGWYSEDGEWGMSPGFEGKDHLGLQRRIPRACMFCHNGLPDVPTDSDLHHKPHTYPSELPHGTGCQRCHGPGADHVRAVLTGQPPEIVRSHITNPRRLPQEERDSVCFQCHMLPSISLIGARHFDRKDYSFRPGQKLAEYMVHLTSENPQIAAEDHFEINHHGYRFWQSKCYSESNGKLACFTCHDPHVKPSSEDFRKKVSGICQDCHKDVRHDPTQQNKSQENDCVACHMPTRRTLDVVKVTMTDHRISRGPFDEEALVKPREVIEPIVTNAKIFPWGNRPAGDEAEIYRTVSVLRTLTVEDGVKALQNLLAHAPQNSATPYLDLIRGQLNLKDYKSASNTAAWLIEHYGSIHEVHVSAGTALMGLGESEKAREAFLQSLKLEETPTGYYNLGLAYYKDELFTDALHNMDKAIQLKPNLYPAWMYKGRALIRLNKLPEGRDALIRCLQIEPNYTPAYVQLVRTLRRMGEEEEAERYLNVGLRVSKEPKVLKALKKQ